MIKPLNILKICFLLFFIISIYKLYKEFVSTLDYNYHEPLVSISRKILLKKHLLKAIRYSRSQSVHQEILQSLILISEDIATERAEMKLNKIQQFERKGEPLDVCLEEYKDAIDHPLYNLGQVEMKCNKKAFKDVLTFIILVDICKEIPGIIQNIRTLYDVSSIIIGTPFNLNCGLAKYINVEIIKLKKSGNILFNILEKVRTEYVLLAPNIYHFDNQSRIERLVQIVSYTDAQIAAGGVRLENGQFSPGCFQMALKMYTLKFVQGYDMSFNSCMYCDYSPAPFVTRTKLLIERFKQKIITEKHTFILDFFTRLMIMRFSQILVCPDVMFHTKSYDLSLIEHQDWFSFISKYELNRVIFSNGKDQTFTCAESKMSCYKQKGLAVPLCCLKELSDSLKFMNKLLLAQNVTFEVIEGQVAGSLKYGNILLWERDADTNFRLHKIDQLESKLDEIKNQGYNMQIYYECPFKRDHEKCRHAGWHGSIYYAYWRTEMYGVTYILSDFRGNLTNPTKINIDGEWYITYTNPALYLRNFYGGDIFKHVEHVLTLGLSVSHYSTISRGQFSKCPRPGFHGCLDNFVGEGGLQFSDLFL